MPTPESPSTFKLTVAYDGTDLAGWQVQPGLATVQGLLQQALCKVTGQSTSVIGSGRTDAGVHAIAQVASVRIDSWRHPAENLRRAVNVHLPDSVVVTDASVASPDFHAIRDATGKRYRYQIQIGGPRSPFQHRYRWHIHTPLDIDAMRAAADRIIGRRDFASFQASGSVRKTTTRHVLACEVIVESSPAADTIHLAVEVEADGFLYNMVRNIVGTLVVVGRGKQPPQWLDEVFAAKNRDAAGPTAPPHGLFLLRVDYRAAQWQCL